MIVSGYKLNAIKMSVGTLRQDKVGARDRYPPNTAVWLDMREVQLNSSGATMCHCATRHHGLAGLAHPGLRLSRTKVSQSVRAIPPAHQTLFPILFLTYQVGMYDNMTGHYEECGHLHWLNM